ncbi:hypothetical protein [uncultured Tateyamaria sp.]|uniref:hypothetical protein n=1 Tax=Tateyamaria sp. 1078 TaxID=3417464 RepID=UPI002634E5B9|nr:hypothetical protein [uncultured Tateyamaria sp.]
MFYIHEIAPENQELARQNDRVDAADKEIASKVIDAEPTTFPHADEAAGAARATVRGILPKWLLRSVYTVIQVLAFNANASPWPMSSRFGDAQTIFHGARDATA